MNLEHLLAMVAADKGDEAEHAQALADYDALCREVDTDPREQQRVRDMAALIDADAALYADALTAVENDDLATARVLLQRAADLGIGDAADILQEITETAPGSTSADMAGTASEDVPPDPETDEFRGDFILLDGSALRGALQATAAFWELEAKRACHAHTYSLLSRQRHLEQPLAAEHLNEARHLLLNYTSRGRLLLGQSKLWLADEAVEQWSRRALLTIPHHGLVARMRNILLLHADQCLCGESAHSLMRDREYAGFARELLAWRGRLFAWPAASGDCLPPLLAGSGSSSRNSQVAQDVMTPAAEMATIPKTMTVDAALQAVLRDGGSGTPVLDGDDLVGVITLTDIGKVLHAARGGQVQDPVGNHMREPVFVTADTPVDIVRRVVEQGETGIAAVLTKSGEVAGYVTDSDLPETQDSHASTTSRPTLITC